MACPLCPQARWRNGKGKLRIDRATQVMCICPSWGVSSLTWAPLRRGFLLPDSGRPLGPDSAMLRFFRFRRFSPDGKEPAQLDRVTIAPICPAGIPQASRARAPLVNSQEHSPERGDRRHAAENHNRDRRAGEPPRSLRGSFRAATRAAAGSCRSSPPDDECPFRTADGAAFVWRSAVAGAPHRTHGKPQWLIVA